MGVRNETICRLIVRGCTYEQVGEVLGISKQRVHQIYNKKYFCSNHFAAIRHYILERDDFKCQFCFKSKNIQVHHLNKVNTDNKPSNLMTLCQLCHHKLHHNKIRLRG